MILLADSGSTKTDWAYFSENSAQFLNTSGINPVTQNQTSIEESLRDLVKQLEIQPKQIFHYGAGCRDLSAKALLFEVYKKYFKNTDIIIESDILASARAVCEGQNGLVCILGTGSNAAYSDGHKILKQYPSLGYILGDEGSSSHLAKKLIHAFYMNQLSNRNMEIIAQYLPQLNETFIFNFYREANQVQKLSTITAFLIQHKHIEEFQNLIREAFLEFIEKRILPFQISAHDKIHTVGSIAYYLSDIFKASLEKHQLNIGNCVQKPITGLVNYHKTYEIH
ncbi:MAG: hypothetical protein IPM92_07235 [Saprospiraceae bacterium]|nr:hypothetical protein [Saprospiraceae bacterium]